MNSYGTKFRLSIFGESHGPLIGVVLDGVPAGMPLSREDFLADLDRRRSGAKGSTPRKESDLPEIVSGVCDGHTTGAPLTIVFRNSNTRSGDYSDFRATPRPGHADFVAERKYRAFNDLRGGGHFSGRLTLTLVAAGVVAKKMIGPIEIRARITELGGIPRERLNCEPGRELGAEGAPTLWDELIDRTLRELDSVGGVIECTCDKVPVGLGEPFFDSLESQLAHLAFSIPAVRGIEFGDGFAAARMKGSEHNDCFVNGEGKPLPTGRAESTVVSRTAIPWCSASLSNLLPASRRNNIRSILRRDGWKSSSSKGGTTPASPCAVRSWWRRSLRSRWLTTDRFLPKIN